LLLLKSIKLTLCSFIDTIFYSAVVFAHQGGGGVGSRLVHVPSKHGELGGSKQLKGITQLISLYPTGSHALQEGLLAGGG